VGNHLVVWLPRAPQTRLIRAAKFDNVRLDPTIHNQFTATPGRRLGSHGCAGPTRYLGHAMLHRAYHGAVGASMVLLVAPIEERDLAAPTASDLVSRTPATELRLGAPAARGPDRVD
jgi:hypothetical protein